jgi:hypothetical protein
VSGELKRLADVLCTRREEAKLAFRRALAAVSALAAVAVLLSSCNSQTGESVYTACGVIYAAQADKPYPPGGPYLGTYAVSQVESAIRQTHDRVLRSELPTWKSDGVLLAYSISVAGETQAEQWLEALWAKAVTRCEAIGAGRPG